MKRSCLMGGLVCAALLWPVSPAQAYALRLKGEGWLYGFGEKSAYFDPEANYAWLEAMLRAQLTLELGAHVVLEARGVGYTTLGRDYYYDLEFDEVEVGDPETQANPLPDFKQTRYNLALDQLSINLERLAGGRLTVKLGRQEILYGEGFVLGDGYDEFGDLTYTRNRVIEDGSNSAFGGAGQYIIPLKSWDAVRVSLDLEPVTVDLMAARLNPTMLPDPGITGRALVPGMVGALDVARDGDYLDLGLTAVGRRVFEADEIDGSDLAAVALRAAGEVGDTTIEGEVVLEAGREGQAEPVDRRALGGRLNVTHTWSMNPFTPFLRASGFFFGGDDPDTDKLEAYDPLFYDWGDFGRWYLGNIASSQWFGNSDSIVAELGVGFQPTPLQNLKLLLYQVLSHTGYTVCGDVLELETCGEGAVGPFAPLLLEANLIWDWAPVAVGKWKPDGKFFFGALGGVAMPLGPMREELGTAPSLELMLLTTVNF